MLTRNCDICKMAGVETPATVDGATVNGPWAYMCSAHWVSHGTGKPTILANVKG